MAQGCFNGDAAVTLADGTRKAARAVTVGDLLATVQYGAHTGSGRVLGRCVQVAAHGKRIKIGELLLSLKHRIMHEGVWMEPHFHPAASVVADDGALYNFVVEDRLPILVEDVVASTIGTHCEGSHHDMWPTHRLWGSEKIVSLFRLHPQWPDIHLDDSDNFLSVLKNAAFAEQCCDADRDHYAQLLATHGWNQSPRSPPLIHLQPLKEKHTYCEVAENEYEVEDDFTATENNVAIATTNNNSWGCTNTTLVKT